MSLLRCALPRHSCRVLRLSECRRVGRVRLTQQCLHLGEWGQSANGSSDHLWVGCNNPSARRPSEAETLLETDPSSYVLSGLTSAFVLLVPFPRRRGRTHSFGPPLARLLRAFTTPPDDAVRSYCPMSVVAASPKGPARPGPQIRLAPDSLPHSPPRHAASHLPFYSADLY